MTIDMAVGIHSYSGRHHARGSGVEFHKPHMLTAVCREYAAEGTLGFVLAHSSCCTSALCKDCSKIAVSKHVRRKPLQA